MNSHIFAVSPNVSTAPYTDKIKPPPLFILGLSPAHISKGKGPTPSRINPS